MSYSLNELINGSRCLLLPTRPFYPFKYSDILNKTFDTWKATWLEVARNTDFTFDENEFYRQDAILSVVGPSQEILGCHLYSFFNLENKCSNNTSFFQKFDQKYYNYLLVNKIFNSFSIEYLTVAKEFRGNKDISLGRAIISLSTQVLKESLFDGIIAQTRDDLNVNKMCIESGADLISDGFKLNGINGSFVAFKKSNITDSPRKNVYSFKSAVWKNKLDPAGLLINQNHNKKYNIGVAI